MDPLEQAPLAPGEISPALRDYIVACVLAAPPSLSRTRALRLLGATGELLPDGYLDGVWEQVERDAARQGCTVADVIFDRAGRDSDPDPV